jgi:cytochrome P450 family 135
MAAGTITSAPHSVASTPVDGLPRGPRLPKAIQTYFLWGHEPWVLPVLRRRYGDAFTIRAAPMGTLVYLAAPADIKAVFTGDPTVFHAGEGNAVLGPVMGQRSVLLIDEDEHLATRRRMLPAFHGEAIQRYGEVMQEVAAAEIATWPREQTFPLHPAMQRITLDVILRAVFGVQDSERLAEMRPLVRRLAAIGGVLMLMWLYPGLGRVGPWRRYRQVQARADELIYDEIARRRADPCLDERTDVLSLLLRGEEPMADQDLRDQLVTLLLAGHETTATSLAWALQLLLRNPRALARAREGDPAYLDAVVKETLRLRPVILDVVRQLKAPVELAGHRLPAGVSVLPAIGLVQRDPKLFPEPDAFRPERFLDADAPGYSWIPFGGGRRRCLGAAFASFEMKTVLHAVLERAELEPVGQRLEGQRMRHITVVPANGSRVRFSAAAAAR